MSYSHQAPYYLGNSVTGGPGYTSAASDAGTDTTTSSGVPVDDNGGMILTLSASTISANDLGEFQSLGSLTQTVSPSASPTPSIAGETAATPSVDIENLLQNEFETLTIREKSRALASVRKFKYPSSAASSEADTEILTKTHAAKIGDKGDTGEAGYVQDKIKPGLADWQALCKVVSVTEDKMPVSITQCKKVHPPFHFHPLSLPNSCLHPDPQRLQRKLVRRLRRPPQRHRRSDLPFHRLTLPLQQA
jgi:hypothetical protein